MARFTLLWLLICPLGLALVWPLLVGLGTQRVKYTIAASLIAFSGLLAMLTAEAYPYAERLCLFTHPSAGIMCVVSEAPALRLSALLCGLLAALIATRSNSTTLSIPQVVFLFASLSAGCLALLSEHFLLRTIALELAAVWFLIELFLALRGDDNQTRSSISAFIYLRVGDIGLLIAIFLMYAASGSFLISHSLEAVSFLPANRQSLTAAGLMLAVWVKSGAWPLNEWARIGQRLHASLSSWFCRLLIPALGGYLLYRSAGLIASFPYFAQGLLLAASVGSLASAFIRIFQTAYRDTILTVQSYGACLLLCLVGVGAGGQVLPALVSFLLARTLVDLLRPTDWQFGSSQRSRRTQWLLWAHMLELFLFPPLVLLCAQMGGSGLWVFFLWTGFGLLFLLTIAKIEQYFPHLEDKKREPRPSLRVLGLVFLSAFSAWGLHHVARFWLISDYTILPLRAFYSPDRVFPMMIASIFSTALILLGVKLAQKSPALQALSQQITQAFRQRANQLPLDKVRFQDMFNQYPRALRLFGEVAIFLYERVEHFTSVEAWHHLQNMLFAVARRLQQLHSGLLRLNLMWILLLLVLLLALYLLAALDVIRAVG